MLRFFYCQALVVMPKKRKEEETEGKRPKRPITQGEFMFTSNRRACQNPEEKKGKERERRSFLIIIQPAPEPSLLSRSLSLIYPTFSSSPHPVVPESPLSLLASLALSAPAPPSR